MFSFVEEATEAQFPDLSRITPPANGSTRLMAHASSISTNGKRRMNFSLADIHLMPNL